MPTFLTSVRTRPLPAVRPTLSVIAFAIVLGFVLFVSLRSPLKDDIAWLLYVARRCLSGRELYVDVVEVNPPLIIWLSAIPLTIAQWLDVDVQTIVMPFFITVVLGCVWWATVCCARGGDVR